MHEHGLFVFDENENKVSSVALKTGNHKWYMFEYLQNYTKVIKSHLFSNKDDKLPFLVPCTNIKYVHWKRLGIF